MQRQLAEFRPTQLDLGVDALRLQLAVQTQAVVGEIQPLALLTYTPGTAAGIQHDLAVRPARRQVQVDLGVELALPGEVIRQPLRQGVEGEIRQAITQHGFGQQALLLAA
ncbi:hypothetical protein D9M68_768060 [compost metagenome]